MTGGAATLVPWLASAAAGLAVVVLVSIGTLTLARRLPPGRSRDAFTFGANCVVLLRRVRADRRLPWRARAVLAAALGYLLSPVQLLPNFLPVIGQLDDVLVVTLALRYCCRLLPRDAVAELWPGDEASLSRLLGKGDATEGHPPGTTQRQDG
ncbi:MAG TPA: DUF1232 domain-containing protein [Acidimicrobiales bacterium]|nr:DUF1232 domain-containing protein [Acidimicrobiales bacterium]